MPETSGRRAVCHTSRVTVHGGNNFATFFRAKYCEPPCLSCKCPQAVTNGALLNSTPFNRAPPQLSQLQMGIHHVNVQGRCDLHLTYGAKPGALCRNAHSGRRRANRRRRSTSFDRFCIVLKTAFVHHRRRDVTSWGNMP